MEEKFYENLREKAKSYLKREDGHSFDHVDRVYKNALKISEEEKDVDLDVIKAATLLHDIERDKESDNEIECHAEEGSKTALEILKEEGFPEEKANKVSYAIKVHRYSKGILPETKEAKILQDADRLDALGAIVIGRVFMFNGSRGLPPYNPEESFEEEYISGVDHSCITHFYRKILKLTPDKFHTKKAKEIAKDRYNFVKDFVERYIKEWEGKL